MKFFAEAMNRISGVAVKEQTLHESLLNEEEALAIPPEESEIENGNQSESDV